VQNPVQYTPVLKLCYMEGFRSMRWESHPMPTHILMAMRVQILSVLRQVDGMLNETVHQE